MVVDRYVTEGQQRRSDAGEVVVQTTLCERVRPPPPRRCATTLCQVLISSPAPYPTWRLCITCGPAISEQPNSLNHYNSAAVREC